MTYLEIVNAVLRRLREEPVSSVTQTTYSTMVGDFVNDAKRYVEGCWDWGANRSDVEVTTSDGTALYAFTGIGQDPEVHGAWNATDKDRLRRMSADYYKNLSYTTTIPSGAPAQWAYAGPDSSGDQRVNIYPTPDGTYTLKFWVSSYQADLSDGEDVLRIPTLPVILRAVAMLAEEKGETGGYTSARYFEMADKALADAISYDAAQYARETEWEMT